MAILKFLEWEDGSMELSRKVTLLADKTIIAYYYEVATSVNITIAATANGSVSPNGTFPFLPNVEYTFIATPENGYYISNWDLSGASKGSSNPLRLTFTAADEGKTLTAVFTANPPTPITLNIAIAGNGATDLFGPQTVNVGDAITVTAIPTAGVAFTGWKLNGAAFSTQNPLTFNVTAEMANATLTAEFGGAANNNTLLLVVVAAAVAAAAALS